MAHIQTGRHTNTRKLKNKSKKEKRRGGACSQERHEHLLLSVPQPHGPPNLICVCDGPGWPGVGENAHIRFCDPH